MGFTNLSKNYVLNRVYGGTDFTPPTNFYLGMSQNNISVSGSNALEPVGNGYARVLIGNSKSNFSVSTTGSLTISASLVFPQSSGSWGTIVDLAMYDSLTSGSVWAFTTLSVPKTVQSDTIVSFDANAISFSL